MFYALNHLEFKPASVRPPWSPSKDNSLGALRNFGIERWAAITGLTIPLLVRSGQLFGHSKLLVHCTGIEDLHYEVLSRDRACECLEVLILDGWRRGQTLQELRVDFLSPDGPNGSEALRAMARGLPKTLKTVGVHFSRCGGCGKSVAGVEQGYLEFEREVSEMLNEVHQQAHAKPALPAAGGVDDQEIEQLPAGD